MVNIPQNCTATESQNSISTMVWSQNVGFKLQVLVCIIATLYYQFKESSVLKEKPIRIIRHSGVVEQHLSRYRQLIGNDFDGYRNHIYRVMTYANHFLHDDESQADVVGTALVYHDIGLWTAGTLAYLEPGVEVANKECALIYTPEQLELLSKIIVNHHKLWPFKGGKNARIVEAVRKADWIDATNGIFNKGMPRSHIAEVKSAIPAAGFYQTLADFGPRLHGSNVYKILSEIVQIYKW